MPDRKKAARSASRTRSDAGRPPSPEPRLVQRGVAIQRFGTAPVRAPRRRAARRGLGQARSQVSRPARNRRIRSGPLMRLRRACYDGSWAIGAMPVPRRRKP